AAAALRWPGLVALLQALRAAPWPLQPALVRGFYDPLLPELYDFTASRLADLDQLERLAAAAPSRERFLTELTLDPPGASGAPAGRPLKDEDYLILSTIHSAKGQEWRAVYILNLVDGCIPSDMATGSPESIEEERRLLYVAMTRARDQLHLLQPERFYVTHQARQGDRHVRAPRTRFIPNALLRLFELTAPGPGSHPRPRPLETMPAIDLAAGMRKMWE
ncbi:MAG: 3'-5' exonuclease, partial [Geminicoccaceae bacterium]